MGRKKSGITNEKGVISPILVNGKLRVKFYIVVDEDSFAIRIIKYSYWQGVFFDWN